MAEAESKRERWPRPTIPQRAAASGPGREELPARQHEWKQTIDTIKKMYRYSPLPKDTTRLLVLKKRTQNDDIFVELLQVPFSELGKDDNEYTALSYHWGSGEARTPIYLADLTALQPDTAAPGQKFYEVVNAVKLTNAVKHKQFRVKPMLYEALLSIRNNCAYDQDLKIWVDAICIDQENAGEKEEQVQRMSEIYSKAARVLIWLGVEDDLTKAAMRFLKDDLSKLDTLRDLVLDRSQAKNWQALLWLMKSSWFSRRWIIQELAFAQDAVVFCGNDSVHWYDLRDGITHFSEYFDTVRDMLGGEYKSVGEMKLMKAKRLIDTIPHVFKTQSTAKETKREPLQSLEYLVSSLSTYDTSDPRDTINAFRNISRETFRSPNTAFTHHADKEPPGLNYKSSLLEVYVGFVKWIYDSTGRIDILCRPWAIPEREPKDAPPNYPPLSLLPSWIQTVDEHILKDKSIGTRRRGDPFIGMPGDRSYNASYNLNAKVHFGMDGPCSDPDCPLRPRDGDESNGATADVNNAGHTNLDVVRPPRQRSASVSQVPTVLVSSPEDSRTSFSSSPDSKRKRTSVDQDCNGIFRFNGSPPMKRSRKSPPPNIETGAIHTNRSHGLIRPVIQRMGSDAISPFAPPSPTESERGQDDEVLKKLSQNTNAHAYVQGLRIGEVTWMIGPTTDGVVPVSALSRLLGDGLEPDPSNVSDRLWRPLIAERGCNGALATGLSHRACMWVMANITANAHINTKELLASEPPPPNCVIEYLKRVQEVIWHRCCIEVTVSGRQLPAGKKLNGFAPSDAKKGDILCILFGCNVPCLLRACKDHEGNTAYRMIGETYVYGLMDGEAISTRPKERLEKDRTYFKLL